MVDIYRDAKRRGIYPPLFTDPEGDSCFSIYQTRPQLFKRWITLSTGIHRINHYPFDIAIGFAITYPVDSDLSGG